MRVRYYAVQSVFVSYDADPPSMKCVPLVTSAVGKSSVRLVCRITSNHSLTDARITWDAQQHLRPVVRPGLPPGVKYDRDGEYLAYLRQVTVNGATVM